MYSGMQARTAGLIDTLFFPIASDHQELVRQFEPAF